MSTFIYADLSDEEREKVLKNLAVGTEQKEFGRSLNEGEAAAENEQYTREAMHLQGLQLEKKRAAKTAQSGIDALQSVMNERLTAIAAGKRNVTEKVFLVPNLDKGIMYFVSSRGEIVGGRELEGKERQTRLMLADGEGVAELPPELTGNEEPVTLDIEHEVVNGKGGQDTNKDDETDDDPDADLDDDNDKTEKPYVRPLMAEFENDGKKKETTPKKKDVAAAGKKDKKAAATKKKKVAQSPEHPSGEAPE